VLPHLRGRVLDLGCGLGNLSVAAARAGASVVALDACDNAVADLHRRAQALGLDITVRQADLRGWRSRETYDAVACIGLLMFFDREAALAGLQAVHDAVEPGGVAAVNVLTEGTTFLDMFDEGGHHLFARAELEAPFAGWAQIVLREDDFPAPNGTLKRFLTLIARRPA
jgi:tellurite methyltransferase